jgi:hypothetical protein
MQAFGGEIKDGGVMKAIAGEIHGIDLSKHPLWSCSIASHPDRLLHVFSQQRL